MPPSCSRTPVRIQGGEELRHAVSDPAEKAVLWPAAHLRDALANQLRDGALPLGCDLFEKFVLLFAELMFRVTMADLFVLSAYPTPGLASLTQVT